MQLAAGAWWRVGHGGRHARRQDRGSDRREGKAGGAQGRCRRVALARRGVGREEVEEAVLAALLVVVEQQALMQVDESVAARVLREAPIEGERPTAQPLHPWRVAGGERLGGRLRRRRSRAVGG